MVFISHWVLYSPSTDEPTDMIPRSCQLATDVPHVTQLLNMTKVCQTEIKFGGHRVQSAESGRH